MLVARSFKALSVETESVSMFILDVIRLIYFREALSSNLSYTPTILPSEV